MTDVAKLLDHIRPPLAFRDFVVTITGLASIIFLSTLYGNDFEDLRILLQLGRIELDIVLVIAGFILGRVLYSLSRFFEAMIASLRDILVFLFLEEHSSFKRNMQVIRNARLRSILRQAFCDNIPNTISSNETGNLITHLDVVRTLKEHPFLGAFLESNYSFTIMFHIAAATTVIAAYSFSNTWLLATMVFYGLILRVRRMINRRYHSLNIGIAKYLQHGDRKDN